MTMAVSGKPGSSSSSVRLGRMTATTTVGLALTLTVVGLSLVLGKRMLEERVGARFFKALPIFGALGLTVLGVVLFLQGVLKL